jgi:mannosyltransferase OCH1-like enzyme
MPVRYVHFGELWQTLNPQHTLVEWTKERCEDELEWSRTVVSDIYRNGPFTSIAHDPDVAKATQAADVYSAEILYRYGGVYTNCDIEPIQPLSAYPFPDTSWACYEIAHWLNNGVMGCPTQQSVFWLDYMAALERRYFSQEFYGQAMHIATGPHHLTNFVVGRSDFTPLPRHLFHHASYDDVPIGGDVPAELVNEARKLGAIGIHRWNHRTKDARTDC